MHTLSSIKMKIVLRKICIFAFMPNAYKKLTKYDSLILLANISYSFTVIIEKMSKF